MYAVEPYSLGDWMYAGRRRTRSHRAGDRRRRAGEMADARETADRMSAAAGAGRGRAQLGRETRAGGGCDGLSVSDGSCLGGRGA